MWQIFRAFHFPCEDKVCLSLRRIISHRRSIFRRIRALVFGGGAEQLWQISQFRAPQYWRDVRLDESRYISCTCRAIVRILTVKTSVTT